MLVKSHPSVEDNQLSDLRFASVVDVPYVEDVDEDEFLINVAL